VNITFQMQRQQQNNWCWSATSTSVELFYNSASAWTQCSVANSALGRNDCCGAGAGGACNQPWYLDRALQLVNHLNVFSGGVITPDQIDGEMGQGRPVGVRTAWSGGGAHVLALSGRYTMWDQSQSAYINWVSVSDPWYGDSDVRYSTFQSSYQGSGTWTHTYTTKP
jgi:hypothetical protein